MGEKKDSTHNKKQGTINVNLPRSEAATEFYSGILRK